LSSVGTNEIEESRLSFRCLPSARQSRRDELWYDQWLKAIGSVVVKEPRFRGADSGLWRGRHVAGTAPALRAGSAGFDDLSDGKVVSCEQDVTGRQIVGIDVSIHTGYLVQGLG